MSIKIVEVNNKTLRREFVKFPIELYKGNPYYVPALIFDEMNTLNENKNPAFEFCEQQLFLAYKDNKVVGRIAAIINQRSNEVWNQKQVRFGFVDFIDDNEVVDALFSNAEKWGKSNGMEVIHGPMGYSDMDKEGLLIEGYDQISTMATIYNFPYYKNQIERIGFKKDVDWHEFLIPVPEAVPERHQRIANIVAQKHGLKLLKFKNLKQVSPYVTKLFNMLNVAYAPLYGFVPLSQKQIDYYVKMYVPILRWDLVSIIIKEETDDVVGFAIAMPSLSLALQKAKGKLLPTGWFPLLKAMKSKKNKVVDLLLMGVAPEYQGKGVNAIIFNDFIPSAYKCGFKFAETNPELEQNNKISALWDGFGAVHHKTRRAYMKEID